MQQLTYTLSRSWRNRLTLTTFILVAYALAGSLLLLWGKEDQAWLVESLVFVVLPLCGVAGYWLRAPKLLLISCLGFATQIFRLVGEDAWINASAPISLSFRLSDFAQGTGWLFDLFAASMFLWLLFLARYVHQLKKRVD